MSQWHNTIRASDLPLDGRKVVNVEGISIILFNLEGDFYALENQCTHENFPLADGDIEDGILTCPLHQAKFSIKTGEVQAPPAFEDVPTYNTRIEKGIIQIYL